MTAIAGSTVLVTGGSRGIGRALAESLYDRGAKNVYATARTPRTITHTRAVALPLEVTDPASVAAAAEQALDVNILINNAGGAWPMNFPARSRPAWQPTSPPCTRNWQADRGTPPRRPRARSACKGRVAATPIGAEISRGGCHQSGAA